MEKSAAELRAEINRLAATLDAMDSQPAKKEASEKTAGRTLLAEIDDLEEKIAGMYATDEEPDPEEITADDDDDADDDAPAEEPVEEPVEVESSESAPGIEDEITQDKFTEVEDTRPAAPQTSGPSMRSVAPTNYTARLMQASERLDKVADYLEKNGRIQLAHRIDVIADAIDTHIQQSKEA